MRALALALILLAVPLAGCVTEPTDPAADDGPGQAGGPPQWAFTDLEGTTHDQDTVKGTPTVLFFMATWCTSCQGLTDDLAAIHEEYNPQGVDVLSLSWDQTETEEDLANWKERYDQNWPHGIDPGSSTARTMGVRSQSTVVVLDADGELAHRFGYGQGDRASVEAILEQLEW